MPTPNNTKLGSSTRSLTEPVDEPRQQGRRHRGGHHVRRRDRAGHAVRPGAALDEQDDAESHHRDRHPSEKAAAEKVLAPGTDITARYGASTGKSLGGHRDGESPAGRASGSHRTRCAAAAVGSRTCPRRPEPYDALLLVSFGGPEKPDDVMPFLENVTRGRGIPRERLDEVGEHYFAFGGRSPINDQCRDLLAAIRGRLRRARARPAGLLGQPQLGPYLTDTVARMAADGVRRAACFVTSAYASYSGCRQYRENLVDAAGADRPRPTRPRLDKLRHYFNHPGFVDGVRRRRPLAALAELPEAHAGAARLVFVTHSIPPRWRDAAVPTAAPTSPSTATVAAAGRRRRRASGPGDRHPWRAGLLQPLRLAAAMPWLEPDVNDHLERCARSRGDRGRRRADRLRVRPHGGRLRPRHRGRCHGRGLGLRVRRARRRRRPPELRRHRPRPAARAGRRRARARPARRASSATLGPTWDVCAADCCPNPRGRAPGAVRAPRRDGCRRDRRPATCWRLAEVDRAGGGRGWSSRAARRGSRGRRRPSPARPTSSPRSTWRRRADPRAHRWSARPTTGSSARRATTSRARRGVTLGRRPDRRHRQLPLRHPALRGLDRRRGRRRGRRGRRPQPVLAARRSPRSAGGGAWLDGEPIRVSTAPTLSQTLVGTGFSYRADVRARPGRRDGAGCCRGSATSGGWARPRSTSATSPADGSTRTSSAASSHGTWRRDGSSSRRPAARRGTARRARRGAAAWPRLHARSSTRSTRSWSACGFGDWPMPTGRTLTRRAVRGHVRAVDHVCSTRGRLADDHVP